MPSSTRQEVGRLLVGSFAGPSPPVELRALAREFDLGGLILFSRNIEAPEQVSELAAECEALGREAPCWVSVDQEGGRVARLRAPFTEWPPMATLGRAGSPALAERFARALAAELSAVGVTLDFAPVLDVHTNPRNPVIGDRALADSASTVAALGRIIVRALQDGGVAACGKHFPGHGDTSTDSHIELPVVEHGLDRLRAVEWVPFRAAIADGVAFLMTAHVLVPAVDARQPATLSARLVGSALRDELGFDGVVVSDDLEMKALSADRSVPDAAVAAVAAGCDLLLVCSGNVDVQAAVLEALIQAVESGTLPRARVDQALRRLRAARERFLVPWRPAWRTRRHRWRTVVGCDAHRAIAEEMAAFL